MLTSMDHWVLRIFFWGAFLLPTLVFAESIEVKYPAFSQAFDEYALKVLELSLNKSRVKYNLQQLKPPLPQERALAEVKRKGGLDLTWAMTSKTREKDLRAIRIPIDKGLIGWRLLLIKKGDESMFKKLKDISEIKKLLVGQGHDWPDTEILKANGFYVFESSSFEGLFQMLRLGRIDFMSRSVLEIWSESEKFSGKGIVVEETLALHYPAPLYFFVRKENSKLGDSIENGLQKAVQDKTFDKVFNEWVGPLIKKSRLNERRVFHLNNSLLSEETPLQKKEYWYRQK